MSSRRPRTFRVRDAGHRDLDAFMNLIRHADPDHPSPFHSARLMLGLAPEPPLSHNLNLCLMAEDRRGKPVGALLAGPPDWLVEHPGLHGSPLTLALVHRMTMIQGVAVDPKYRRRGLGTALIRRAEQRYREAGWGLSMLIHSPSLEPFYQRRRRHGPQAVGAFRHLEALPHPHADLLRIRGRHTKHDASIRVDAGKRRPGNVQCVRCAVRRHLRVGRGAQRD